MTKLYPYTCPEYKNDGKVCPNRVYPECYANAPPEVRAYQHHSTCRAKVCLAKADE